MRWYVAKTKVSCEFKALRNLRAELIEAYCPVLPIRGFRRVPPAANACGASADTVLDDEFSGSVPMLRRCVFVRPAHAGQLWAVGYVRGVVELMRGASPNPIPVTDEAIVSLRETEADLSERLLAPTLRVSWMPDIDQRVRVISGSYVGEWVTVIGGDAEKGIVRGLVHIFGALRPAWIAVEALDPDTAHFEEDAVVPARRSYLKRDGRQKAMA